jgi:hypothetical protein
MDAQKRSMARHALGLPNHCKRSFRNRYHTHASSDAWHEWTALCDAGLAVFSRGTRYDLFSLTRAGAEMVLEPGETLDLEDFDHD